MAEENSNAAEAHLIGSLIESLSHTGEDEVFFGGGVTPNSSLPLTDTSADQLLTKEELALKYGLSSSNLMNVSSSPPTSLPPHHLLPHHLLQQIRHQSPPVPFWTPPNSTVPIRGRPPYSIQQLPPSMPLSNFSGHHHARWVPSPLQNIYGPHPPTQSISHFTPIDLQQHQQYQAYLAYQQQQQMYDYANMRQPMPAQISSTTPQSFSVLQQSRRQNQETNSTVYQPQADTSTIPTTISSSNHEQWESIYTPFGPVRGGNFSETPSRLMSQRSCTIEDTSNRFTNSNDQRTQQANHRSGENSLSEFDMKKRSASMSSPSQENINAISSSSSSVAPTTTSCSTTASSPLLPPKGRSYRDVAKTKTETKNANSKAKKSSGGASGQEVTPKGIDIDQSSFELPSSRPTSSDQKLLKQSPAMSNRKYSAAARESSSDSMSEFGGSENGGNISSSATPVPIIDGKYVAEFLDEAKRSSTNDDREEEKLSDRNVLKKNATTATTTQRSGDFQKIIRRKGSQTKLLGRDSSLVVAGASRYAVLGKKSPSKSESIVDGQEITNSITSSMTNQHERQQQRIKLNNEQTSPRFNSKSPTRKAAYINNDLSWPGRNMKSINRRNENGDWIENEDDDEGNLEDGRNSATMRGGRRGDGDLEDEMDLDQYEMEDSDDDGEGDEEIYENEQQRTRSKKKIEIGDGSVKNRKKITATTTGKKGKTKRGDSGDLAKKRRQQRGVVMRWINWVLTVIACYVRDAAVWLVNLVTDIGHQLWEITLYCTKSFCIKISTSAQYAWYSTGERLRKMILCIRQKEWSILLWWRSRRKNRGGDSDQLGLEENIDLPNTGEEALKRLLSCRGQDAYSILGLRLDCTDEEVKCYYRRQAILVHPDKNACYGSDEAFKILAAAFELIGTAERRRQYDLQNLHRTKAMQDLQEMLAKLKEKMEEIRSTMQCDCGGKHKRFPTERELAYARYCRKCGEKHHAREGDIWAESHWFGFLWYYYACMDGVVYDITEWAGCQKNNLKHMKPDTHLVQYRLITGRNARQFHQQQQNQSTTGVASSSSGTYGGQQQYSNSQQFNRQTAEGMSSNGNNAPSEDVLNRYWEERLSSKNVSAAASSMYLPTTSTSTPNYSGLGGVDFSTPTQSKFNPPTCASHGDSRPRKAGRRRKPK